MQVSREPTRHLHECGCIIHEGSTGNYCGFGLSHKQVEIHSHSRQTSHICSELTACSCKSVSCDVAPPTARTCTTSLRLTPCGMWFCGSSHCFEPRVVALHGSQLPVYLGRVEYYILRSSCGGRTCSFGSGTPRWPVPGHSVGGKTRGRNIRSR